MSKLTDVDLWSGNVPDKNKALQLLWIIDIIKFWAQYTYKPMIGACVALKAHLDKQEKTPLEEQEGLHLEYTLWKYHITLNEENTPWFLHAVNAPRNKKSQHSEEYKSCPELSFNFASSEISHLVIAVDLSWVL